MTTTKKKFKADCNEQTYTGWNGKKIRINAFFFDWKSGEDKAIGRSFAGYKYMVSSNVMNISKAKLFDLFYKWVENGEDLPYYVDYKYAINDIDRFKVPLSIKSN